MEINKFINESNHRLLATNYLNCPIAVYSGIPSNDYSTANSECGIDFFSFQKKKKENRRINKGNNIILFSCKLSNR